MHKEEERRSMNVQAGRGWCMVGKKAEWVKDAELSLFHSSGA